MPAQFPGRLSAAEAVERYRINYHLLRALLSKGVFTRGNFGGAQVRPPIYVRVAELEAWKSGGVSAVAAAKAGYQAEQPATSSGSC